MKKKVFREKYYNANIITAKNAIEMIDKAVDFLDDKKKATKKGKKNAKSSK